MLWQLQMIHNMLISSYRDLQTSVKSFSIVLCVITTVQWAKLLCMWSLLTLWPCYCSVNRLYISVLRFFLNYMSSQSALLTRTLSLQISYRTLLWLSEMRCLYSISTTLKQCTVHFKMYCLQRIMSLMRFLQCWEETLHRFYWSYREKTDSQLLISAFNSHFCDCNFIS